MKTFMAATADVERKWYVVDAEGQTLGRLSSEIAKVLRGKNKTIFTPHIDTGDYVIVINAEKIRTTGKKLDQKIYYSHSDYPGGMREMTLREMLKYNLIQYTGFLFESDGTDGRLELEFIRDYLGSVMNITHISGKSLYFVPLLISRESIKELLKRARLGLAPSLARWISQL